MEARRTRGAPPRVRGAPRAPAARWALLERFDIMPPPKKPTFVATDIELGAYDPLAYKRKLIHNIRSRGGRGKRRVVNAERRL